MAELFDKMPTRTALVSIAKLFYQRGWMAGTAGNLSARSNKTPGSFWITSSGLPKGQLDNHDFILIDQKSCVVSQRFHEEIKPSAETSIHKAVYDLFPDVGACFHVHSIAACLAAECIPADQNAIPLPALEMLKGLDIWDENPDVGMPLFENLADVSEIAAQIYTRFKTDPPIVPALMIRNHGVTVWGASVQQAFNRLEVVEFLMNFLARQT